MHCTLDTVTEFISENKGREKEREMGGEKRKKTDLERLSDSVKTDPITTFTEG